MEIFKPSLFFADRLIYAFIAQARLIQFRCADHHACAVTTIFEEMIAGSGRHMSGLALLPAHDLHDLTELPEAIAVDDSINDGVLSLLPCLQFYESRCKRTFMMVTISSDKVNNLIGALLVEKPCPIEQALHDDLIPRPDPLPDDHVTVFDLLLVGINPVISHS